MKPTKNKVFCKDCERIKMLFETEKKAQNFIKFNKEEIEAESGYSPERSYYCLFCGGWHITSIKENIGISKKEQFFEEHKQDKENPTIIINSIVDHEEERNKKIEDLQGQINQIEFDQKEKYFSENISILKKEIEILSNPDSSRDNEKLKELRQKLEVLYFVRKQNGFNKKNNTAEKLRERELEEWKIWAEKQGHGKD